MTRYLLQNTLPSRFSGTPLGETYDGDEYLATVLATDPMNNPVEYTLIAGTLPYGAFLDPMGTISGKLSLRNVPNTVTDYTSYTWDFTIRASDGIKTSDQDFAITVLHVNVITWEYFIINGGSQVPITNGPVDLGAYSFQTDIDIEFGVFDGQNQPVIYTLNSGTLPAGLSLSGPSLIGSITPNPPRANAVYDFILSASDSVISSNQEFTLTELYVERPPIWNAPFTYTANSGTSINYNISATQLDGYPITYSLQSGSGPSGLTVSNSGDVVWVTTISANAAVYTFVAIADDGLVQVPQTFTIDLQASILAPYFTTAQAPTAFDTSSSIYAGASYNYQFAAVDPQGFPLTFSGSGLPAGMSMSSSGLFSGTLPASTSVQTYSFSVSINNGYLTTVGNFTFTVAAQLFPPTWITPAGSIYSGNINSSISVQLQGQENNPSGTSGLTPLSYSLTSGSLPTGMTLSSTGLVSGTLPNVTNPNSPQTISNAAISTEYNNWTVNGVNINSSTYYNGNYAGGSPSKVWEINPTDLIFGAPPFTPEYLTCWVSTANTTYDAISPPYKVIGGSTISVSLQTMKTNTNAPAFMKLEWQDSTGTFISYSSPVSLDPSAYLAASSFSTTQVAPSNAEYVLVHYYMSGAAQSASGFAGGNSGGTPVMTTNWIASQFSITGTGYIIPAAPYTTTYTFGVTISDGVSSSVEQTFTIESVSSSYSPPVWNTSSLVAGYQNTAYSTQLVATDPQGLSLTYSIVSGTLPNGVTLSSSGLLSGTPNVTFSSGVTNTYSIVVSASNGYQSANQSLSLLINEYSGIMVINGVSPTYGYGYVGTTALGEGLFGGIINGTFKGQTITAINAYGTSSGITGIFVVVSGNQSGTFLNTVTINGTLMVGNHGSPVYHSATNETSFFILLIPSMIPSPFGTTSGTLVPVVLT